MPRLSVLMPVYNSAATLPAAVKSTLRALPEDSELVILDDGSTDRTLALAQGFTDQRVRVLSQSNAGVAAALNALLSASDSEFIARMDADDIVLPGRFGRQLRAVQSGGADGVFTSTVHWGSGLPRPPRPSTIGPEDFALHLLLTNPVAHSTLLARREAIAAVGGYRDLPTEDYDLWLRLAAAGTRLQRLAVPGLAYRIHPGQVTASAQWRRSSWENASLGASYAQLAERLLGSPAKRITTLSIDADLSAAQKLAAFDAFSVQFNQAVAARPPKSRRVLHRKLRGRRSWLTAQLSTDQSPR